MMNDERRATRATAKQRPKAIREQDSLTCYHHDPMNRQVSCQTMARGLMTVAFQRRGVGTRTTRPLLLVRRQHSHSSRPILPYSGSLPSPGHEWCSRCRIPSKQLQKAIHEPNPCLEIRPIWTICQPAKKYHRQQAQTMLVLTAVCFVALPGFRLGEGDDEDSDN